MTTKPLTTSPRCPKEDDLYALIKFFHTQIEYLEMHDADEHMHNVDKQHYLVTINALRYLLNSLQYRRLQHKKQQIKKQIIAKIARELNMDNEIDQAVELEMQRHVAAQEPEPPEEELDTEGDAEDFEQEETR